MYLKKEHEQNITIGNTVKILKGNLKDEVGKVIGISDKFLIISIYNMTVKIEKEFVKFTSSI